MAKLRTVVESSNFARWEGDKTGQSFAKKIDLEGLSWVGEAYI